MYLVDDQGVEYDYPRRAAPPGRVDHRGELIATASGDDARTQREVAAFLLHRAQMHRASLRDGLSLRETVRYRSVDAGLLGRDIWTPAEARRMGSIERLRIYRTTINASAEGLTVENESRTLVYTYPDSQQ